MTAATVMTPPGDNIEEVAVGDSRLGQVKPEVKLDNIDYELNSLWAKYFEQHFSCWHRKHLWFMRKGLESWGIILYVFVKCVKTRLLFTGAWSLLLMTSLHLFIRMTLQLYWTHLVVQVLQTRVVLLNMSVQELIPPSIQECHLQHPLLAHHHLDQLPIVHHKQQIRN